MLKLLIIPLLLALTAISCKQNKAPEKVNLNAGKHKLAEGDPRSWDTYPIVVLVAVKHHVGVDTVAQLLRHFEKRFEGNEDGPQFEAQLSVSNYNSFEEDTPSASEDVRFFTIEGERYKLYPSVIADIISDFYLIGGSNRDYPESAQR